jgi:putative tryptophan/tyrosine transport system substrate-binding protein
MRRRAFSGAMIVAATVARAVVDLAQAKEPPSIGYINGAAPDDAANLLAAFKVGLNDAGYVEGRNVSLQYRWAEGHYERLPALADDLVRRQVAVIAATSTPVALAAKAATSTIPVVFTVGADPVKVGLVASLSRPAGNLTGVTRFNVELGPKRLELLHECIPNVTRIAVLVNPHNLNTETLKRELETAAHALRLQIHVFEAGARDELAAVFEALGPLNLGALMIGNDPLFNGLSSQLAELTVSHGIPAIYQYHAFAEAGGLLSYGASNTDSHRQLGIYAGRILDGARPADLPVEQSTKIDLIINLRTARSLHLTVPQSLLARADEVIEDAR